MTGRDEPQGTRRQTGHVRGPVLSAGGAGEGEWSPRAAGLSRGRPREAASWALKGEKDRGH